MAGRFWVETLGCPKNQVDSDKLLGTLLADGMTPSDDPGDADLVVVNTCAFVEAARQESIDTVLALADQSPDARLVVTGCLAERYGDELAAALPEADVVAGFGQAFVDAHVHAHAHDHAHGNSNLAPGAVRVELGVRGRTRLPDFDLLNLPRPASTAPWGYVKVAEGCDRACGFCAIPSFRGPQRSRRLDDVVAEVDELDVREVVLVAQDLAAYGRDQGQGERAIVPLVRAVAERVDRVRLLYLYPSDLTDTLIDTMLDTGVAYFDLSLQHVSAPLLRRMRRWGDGDRFIERIAAIRRREPGAAFRSNFILGYPGETEADHDALLRFVAEAELDWCGLFTYSEEEGTHAAGLEGKVPAGLAAERLAEVSELQDAITATRRDALVGKHLQVLVDAPGAARSWREAPEIDGIVVVPEDVPTGAMVEVEVTASLGTDLEARPVGHLDPWRRRDHVPAPAATGDGEGGRVVP
jgi:ribosomal protein S12 methylthiotransferase